MHEYKLISYQSYIANGGREIGSDWFEQSVSDKTFTQERYDRIGFYFVQKCGRVMISFETSWVLKRMMGKMSSLYRHVHTISPD